MAVAALMLAGVPAGGAYAEQSATESNQIQTATAQPQGYYSPCDRKTEDRNSDLCAQWRAVDWSRRSYIVGWLGVAGLVITLLFNLEAWNRARKAQRDTETAMSHAEASAAAATKLADTAETTARAELRPYLDFDGVRIERWPKMDPQDSGDIAVRASVRIKNYGKTPAENLEVVTNNFISIKDGDPSPFTTEDKIDFGSIAPGDHATHYAHWSMPKIYWAIFEAQKAVLIMSLIVTYTDVFTKPHVLRCDFKTLSLDEELGFVRGTRKST